MISREVTEFYERGVIPTVVYDSKTWSLSTQERGEIEEFERKMYASRQSKKFVNEGDRCAGVIEFTRKNGGERV